MPSLPPTVLHQLAAPHHYRACDWDLGADAAGRQQWDHLFRWHLDDVLLPLIRTEYPDAPAARLEACRREYLARLDDIAVRPEAQPRVDVLYYTQVRESLLQHYGFDDPFRAIKQQENEAALDLLPEVLAEIDAAPPQERPLLLARGLMAGNIFDLGAKATIQMHRDGNTAFRATRERLPARPWRYDDLAAWEARWNGATPYREAVFFVDNAGGDVTLACLPLARWLVAQGMRVTLAANTRPALNDITAAELGPLLERAAELDGPLASAVRDGRLRVLASGSTAPLIDLTRLAPAFVTAVANADLIMLHGMGRAIESNFHVDFRCDVLRTAVLKDEAVAGRIGAQIFDCVFRFTPAASRA